MAKFRSLIPGLLIVGAYVLLLVMCGCAVTIGPKALRQYSITFTDKDKTAEVKVLASHIARHDGCVVFYRGNRVDTILCVPVLERLVVTEMN